MKIVSGNQFSGKTYSYTIASSDDDDDDDDDDEEDGEDDEDDDEEQSSEEEEEGGEGEGRSDVMRSPKTRSRGDVKIDLWSLDADE